MASSLDVGLKAILEPEFDDQATDRAVDDLEEAMEKAEELEIDADMSAVEEKMSALGKDVGAGGFGRPGGGGGGGGQQASLTDLASELGGPVAQAAAGKLEGTRVGGAISKGASRLGVSGAAASGGSGGAMGAAAGGLTKVALGGAIAVGLLKGVQKMSKASPLLGKVVSMFSKAIDLFIRPFGRFLGKVLMPFAKPALKAMAAFNRIVTEKGLIVGGVEAILRGINRLPGAFSGAVVELGKNLSETLLGTDLGIGNTADFLKPVKFTHFIKGGIMLGDYIIGKGIDLGEWVADGIGDLVDWVSDGLGDLSDWVTGGLGDLSDWIDNGIGDLSDWVENGLGDLTEYIDTNLGPISDYFTVQKLTSVVTPVSSSSVLNSVSVGSLIDGTINIANYITRNTPDTGDVPGGDGGWLPSGPVIPDTGPVIPGDGGDGGGPIIPDTGPVVPQFQFASGGVVTDTTSAVIGEGSESEAVLPLSKLSGMLDRQREAGAAQASASVGGNEEMRESLDDISRTLDSLLRLMKGSTDETNVKVDGRTLVQQKERSGKRYSESREVIR